MEKFMNYVCLPLIIIGALNWGLVGAFNFNLVSVIFGFGLISRIIYTLVGISALCVIYSMTKMTPKKKN